MPRSKQDDVKKAEPTIRRGINRLIALLGDCNRSVLAEASLALDNLGTAAVVGPLAAALARAKSPGHRLAIVGMLVPYAVERNAEVAGALARAVQRERDPQVSATIRAALSHVIASGLVSQMQRPARVQGDGPA